MCPEIVSLGPFTVHGYGLMLALAFFAGIWYIKYRCVRERLPFDRLLTVSYFLIFGGVIGARLAYVLLHTGEFSGNLQAIVNPFHDGRFGISGMNLYGGIIVAVVSALVYLRIKKLPTLAVFDLFAPTLGLGLGIARIGCFLNGCCFGTETDLPWGVTFPADSIPDLILGQTALHPTQLYSSLYGVILFIFLHHILKCKRFDGQVMGLLLMGEAFFRHLIEYVRYYEPEMSFSFLGMQPTYNQLVAVLLFLTGALLYLYAPRRLYRAASQPDAGHD